MDRDQARTEYRRILAGVVRHYQALDRHVTGTAMAGLAQRPGLRVKGGVIEANDDEMALVSDLAVYGRVAGSYPGDRPLRQGGLGIARRPIPAAKSAEVPRRRPDHSLSGFMHRW
jgi:hypothetical protein